MREHVCEVFLEAVVGVHVAGFEECVECWAGLSILDGDGSFDGFEASYK